MNKLQLTGALLAHSLLFVALIIGCFYQSWKCIALYNLKETSVKMIVINAKAMRFPAVSVNSGFRREALESMGVTEEEYLSGEAWNFGGSDPDAVYKNVTRDINDVLESIVLRYEDGRVENRDFFAATNAKRISWSDNRGRSHVFHYETPATDVAIGTGIGVERMNLKFKDEADFDALTMSLQHAGRMLAPEIKDSTFKLKKGARTVATVRYSLILLLNKESFPCIGVPEDEKVEFDDCQQEHIHEQLEHEFDCRVPWIIDSHLRVCDNNLAKRATDLYYKSQKDAQCLQPCCTKEVNINNIHFEKTESGSTELELRFPPTVKFYVEIEVYGLVSMLAELSGYIGMFLGVSFFDLKFLIDIIYKNMNKQNRMLTPVKPSNGLENIAY